MVGTKVIQIAKGKREKKKMKNDNCPHDSAHVEFAKVVLTAISLYKQENGESETATLFY